MNGTVCVREESISRQMEESERHEMERRRELTEPVVKELLQKEPRQHSIDFHRNGVHIRVYDESIVVTYEEYEFYFTKDDLIDFLAKSEIVYITGIWHDYPDPTWERDYREVKYRKVR